VNVDVARTLDDALTLIAERPGAEANRSSIATPRDAPSTT